jgi:hypothetical protein
MRELENLSARVGRSILSHTQSRYFVKEILPVTLSCPATRFNAKFCLNSGKMGGYTNFVTAEKPQSTLDAETLMPSAIANSCPNRNSIFEFLLVNDRLNLYPESKPEFRHG